MLQVRHGDTTSELKRHPRPCQRHMAQMVRMDGQSRPMKPGLPNSRHREDQLAQRAQRKTVCGLAANAAIYAAHLPCHPCRPPCRRPCHPWQRPCHPCRPCLHSEDDDRHEASGGWANLLEHTAVIHRRQHAYA